MAKLEILLLGGLHIRHDGVALSQFISSKVPALLAYLAVTRRPHTREALAGLLWGEMPDIAAANNLRQALTNLRKVVEPYLVITRETVAFDPGLPHLLDVETFTEGLRIQTQAVPAQRAEQLRGTMVHYGGDFLKGFFVRDAPDFEDWVLTQRVHLRERALHAWDELASLCMDLGDADGAIEAANHLLAMDPWREEAHRQRMLALARSGQYSAALAQYQACRTVLSAEFDAPPSAETTALYERIRAAMRGPRHNLPASTTGFVGREHELEELRVLLVSPQTRLLTILGPGGVGKTRLALELGASAGTKFLNGVWFVPLATVRAEQPDGLVLALSEALQVATSGADDPRKSLLDFLRGRELLLILDTLEHLPAETAWLCDVLAQAPGVKIVVTSRERLDLQAERIYPLDGLAVPKVGSPVPEASASVELFMRRAQRVRPHFELTPADADAVMRICRMVQGLPLGIELAAAWVHQLTCTEIAHEIEHSLDFLVTTRRDVSPRQRSLRAVFDWSWGHLSPPEQSVFQRLAVFRGTFTRAAAMQVAGASLPALSALVDKSLLRLTGTGYQLHEVVRHFAWEKLDQTGAATQIQVAHARYYAALLADNADRFRGRDQKRALEEVAGEIDNVRKAWQWLVDQRDAAGIDAATDGLYMLKMIRSRFREGFDLFRTARLALQSIAVPDRETELALARVMAREGRFLSSLSQFEAAQALLHDSLAMLRRLDVPAEIAFTLGHIGGVARLQGNVELADACLQECLALRRQAHDFYGQAIALLELGGAAFVRGDYVAARQHCQDGLAIEEAAGDQQTVAHLLTGLSLCHRELGEYAEAQACVRRSLPVYETLGDQYGILQASLTLGEISRQLGNLAEARQYCTRAIQVSQEIGDRSGEADGRYRLGQVTIDTGNVNEALAELRQALNLANEIQEVPLVLDVLLEIGCLLATHGEPQRAIDILVFLLQQPQLLRPRRQRVSDTLDRLNVRADGKQAAGRGRGSSLDQIVVLAGAAEPLPA